MKLKSFVSILLAVLMLVCAAVPAAAEDGVSGTIGSLSYVYDDVSFTLTISGEGAMKFKDDYPWSYYNDVKKIVIGDGVTYISKNAFDNMTSVEEVSIGKSVTSIGDSAFNYCISLKEIEIPSSVASIGWRAFNNCKALEKVTFNKGLTLIDASAFSGCEKLNAVTLPETIEEIGSFAFSDCALLKDITFPAKTIKVSNGAFENTAWYSGQSDGAVYIGTLLYCIKGEPESVTIKDGTEGIAAGAFQDNQSVKTITIPDSVREIGGNAFYRCALESVSLPEKALTLGDLLFYGSDKLKTVKLPSGLKTIPESMFEGCKSLEAVTAPTALETISESAFARCESLRQISLPNTLRSVAECAFSECTALETLSIPASVTSIGSEAFYGCSSLTEVDLPVDISELGFSMFSDCTSLKKISLPDGLKEISGGLLKGCTSLEEVNIPESVKKIGYSAFEGCTALKSINIPYKVKTIESSAFGDCANLADITYTDSVTSVGEYAFNSTLWFKSQPAGVVYFGKVAVGVNVQAPAAVKLKKGTIMIAPRAFFECTNVKSVAINSGVTEIGSSAFAYCTKLSKINIPDTVKTIGDSAFYECKKLKSLTVPKSVKQLGELFYGALYAPTEHYEEEYKLVENTSINGSLNSAAFDYVYGLTDSYHKGLTFNAVMYLKEKTTVKGLFNGKKITYKSSNAKVAAISSKGKITALKTGKATITASQSGNSYKFKVTVKKPEISPKSATIKKGKSFTIKITGKVGAAKYKSSNSSVAAVSQKGVVKGKKKGAALITVRTNGVALECKVKVK